MNTNIINECFKNGYIHNSLYYNINPNEILIDPRKIIYNDYHLYDYYASRFNCNNLIGFDKIIQSILEKNLNKSPLDEILERQNNI